jgi:pyocin large subunit-like protein
MSARCLAWAFAYRVDGDHRAKLALLALADEADYGGRVAAGEPMIARLAELTEMRAIDVRNALLGLIGAGAIIGVEDGAAAPLRLEADGADAGGRTR